MNKKYTKKPYILFIACFVMLLFSVFIFSTKNKSRIKMLAEINTTSITTPASPSVTPQFDIHNLPRIIKPPKYPQLYYLYVQDHVVYLARTRGQWDCSVHNQNALELPYLVSSGIVIENSGGQLCLQQLYEIRAVSEIADPDSLQYVNDSVFYMTDSKYVYFVKEANKVSADYENVSFLQIQGADSLSFKAIEETNLILAKDSHSVYVQNMKLDKVEAETFESLINGVLYKTGNGYYVSTSTRISDNPYAPYDPFVITLVPLDEVLHFTKSVNTEDGYSWYSKDMQHVYYQNGFEDAIKTVVKDADPDTFILLSGLLDFYGGLKDKPLFLYAKDISHVYYAGRIVQSAQSSSFMPIENGAGYHSYGKDTPHVFFQDVLLPEADPKTFQVLWQPVYEGCGNTSYSKDALNVYLGSTTVKGADAATFESLLGGYGRDKHGYFKGLIYVGKDVDQKELICNYG